MINPPDKSESQNQANENPVDSKFTRDALTRPQLSSDLGVGLSTLNKWVQQHQHDDLMSGPHEDVEKENTRLRKKVRLLQEEREVLKKAAIFFAGQSR